MHHLAHQMPIWNLIEIRRRWSWFWPMGREIGYGQLRSTSHGSQKGSRPNGEPCSHDGPTMNRLNLGMWIYLQKWSLVGAMTNEHRDQGIRSMTPLNTLVIVTLPCFLSTALIVSLIYQIFMINPIARLKASEIFKLLLIWGTDMSKIGHLKKSRCLCHNIWQVVYYY